MISTLFLLSLPYRGQRKGYKLSQKFPPNACLLRLLWSETAVHITRSDTSILCQQAGWIDPQFQHLGPQIWPAVTFAAFTFPQYPPSVTHFNYQESFN